MAEPARRRQPSPRRASATRSTTAMGWWRSSRAPDCTRLMSRRLVTRRLRRSAWSSMRARQFLALLMPSRRPDCRGRGRDLDGGQGGAQVVRDGPHEGLLQPVDLFQELGPQGLFPQLGPLHGEGDVVGEGQQQLAVVARSTGPLMPSRPTGRPMADRATLWTSSRPGRRTQAGGPAGGGGDAVSSSLVSGSPAAATIGGGIPTEAAGPRSPVRRRREPSTR